MFGLGIQTVLGVSTPPGPPPAGTETADRFEDRRRLTDAPGTS
jgi:hypothetical protein